MATATNSIRNWFTPQRWWSAAREAVSRVGWRAPLRALRVPHPSSARVGDWPQHPFDLMHGVDTGGLILGDALANGHEHDIHNSGYYATSPSLFCGAVEQWTATLAAVGLGIEDYTFIDIGCGKGRVVMLAAEYAFREVIGVELNPALAQVARQNLRRRLRKPRPSWVSQVRGPREKVLVPGVEVARFWRPGRPTSRVRILEADALSVSIPDGPVVLFFFNSFEREMVRMWLDRLVAAAATRTQPIDVVYIHPEHADLFRHARGVELLAHAVVPFSAEDAAADVFGVDFDCCAVYRLGC